MLDLLFNRAGSVLLRSDLLFDLFTPLCEHRDLTLSAVSLQIDLVEFFLVFDQMGLHGVHLIDALLHALSDRIDSLLQSVASLVALGQLLFAFFLLLQETSQPEQLDIQLYLENPLLQVSVAFSFFSLGFQGIVAPFDLPKDSFDLAHVILGFF